MNWIISALIGYVIGMFYVGGALLIYEWRYKKKHDGKCPFCKSELKC